MAIPFQSGAPKFSGGVPMKDYSGVVELGKGVSDIGRGLQYQQLKQLDADQKEMAHAFQKDWMGVQDTLLNDPNADLFNESAAEFNKLLSNFSGLRPETRRALESSLLFSFQRQSSAIMANRNESAKNVSRNLNERTAYQTALGQYLIWSKDQVADPTGIVDPVEVFSQKTQEIAERFGKQYNLEEDQITSLALQLGQQQQSFVASIYSRKNQIAVGEAQAAGEATLKTVSQMIEASPNRVTMADLDAALTTLIETRDSKSTIPVVGSKYSSYEIYDDKIRALGVQAASNAPDREEAIAILDRFGVTDPRTREGVLDNRDAFVEKEYQRVVTAAINENKVLVDQMTQAIYNDPYNQYENRETYINRINQLDAWAGTPGAEALYEKREALVEAVTWLDYHQENISLARLVSNKAIDDQINKVTEKNLKYGDRITRELRNLKTVRWSDRIRQYVASPEASEQEVAYLVKNLGGTRMAAGPEFQDPEAWPEEMFHNLTPGQVLAEEYPEGVIEDITMAMDRKQPGFTPQAAARTYTFVHENYPGRAEEMFHRVQLVSDADTAAFIGQLKRMDPMNAEGLNLLTQALSGRIGHETQILQDNGLKNMADLEARIMRNDEWQRISHAMHVDENATDEEIEATLNLYKKASLKLLADNAGQISVNDAIDTAIKILATNSAMSFNPAAYTDPMDSIPFAETHLFGVPLNPLAAIVTTRDETDRFSANSNITLSRADIDLIVAGDKGLTRAGAAAAIFGKGPMAKNIVQEFLYDLTDFPDIIEPGGFFRQYVARPTKQLLPVIFGPTTEQRRSLKQAAGLLLSPTLIEQKNIFFTLPGKDGYMSAEDFYRLYMGDGARMQVKVVNDISHDGKRGISLQISNQQFDPESPTRFADPDFQGDNNSYLMEQYEGADGKMYYRKKVYTFDEIGAARRLRDNAGATQAQQTTYFSAPYFPAR